MYKAVKKNVETHSRIVGQQKVCCLSGFKKNLIYCPKYSLDVILKRFRPGHNFLYVPKALFKKIRHLDKMLIYSLAKRRNKLVGDSI